MKSLGFLVKIGFCCTLCASLAAADSLQLRNGRHLQGKYIGGTSTAVGFMSGASVEYFATTDVLAIIFENANDSSLGGAQQPKPMTGSASAGMERVIRAKRVHGASSRLARHSASQSRPLVLPGVRSEMVIVEAPIEDRGASVTLSEGFWPSLL